jgi:hypothetical protein
LQSRDYEYAEVMSMDIFFKKELSLFTGVSILPIISPRASRDTLRFVLMVFAG